MGHVFNVIMEREDKLMRAWENRRKEYAETLDDINTKTSIIQRNLDRMKGRRGIQIADLRRVFRRLRNGGYRYLRDTERLLDVLPDLIIKFFNDIRDLHLKFPEESYDELGVIYFKRNRRLKGISKHALIMAEVGSYLASAASIDASLGAFIRDVEKLNP